MGSVDCRTLHEPEQLSQQWRTVRERSGVPGVTAHNFCKTVAKLIDDEGRLSAGWRPSVEGLRAR
jgi:hypothetical protein